MIISSADLTNDSPIHSIFSLCINAKSFLSFLVRLGKDIIVSGKLTPFFDVTHIHNFGVSFGLFSETIPSLYLIIIGLLVVLFVVYLLLNAQNKLEYWGFFIIICVN